MKYTKTIRASKKSSAPQSVKASSRFARKAVKADEEIDEIEEVEDIAPTDEGPVNDEPTVDVEEAASTLLFEAEDVGELLAEATGNDVVVEVDDEGEGSVTFTVGTEEFVVTPEGDEEVVESSSRVRRARRVSASKRAMASRRAMAARRAQAARRVSASRRASATRPSAARRVSASRRASAARRASARRTVRK